MKTLFFALLSYVIIILQISCNKNSPSAPCTPKTVASEEPTIVGYASSSGINATRDSSGVYYKIDSLGSGPAPDINSKVFITYTGKLLNGTVFDRQAIAAQTGYQLGSLIRGLQIGLPLIKKGGGIKLIIPSSLAFGCNGYGGVPPNAIVQYDVQLVDVQ